LKAAPGAKDEFLNLYDDALMYAENSLSWIGIDDHLFADQLQSSRQGFIQLGELLNGSDGVESFRTELNDFIIKAENLLARIGTEGSLTTEMKQAVQSLRSNFDRYSGLNEWW
jgi:hypothetical protein